MKKLLTILFLLAAFYTEAQVYQTMPQSYKQPRVRLDSVLTIPMGIERLRNISGGRDSGQIRYRPSDSSLYVYTGYQWVKPSATSTTYTNIDSSVVNGTTVCLYSGGIVVTCFTLPTAPGDTTITGVTNVTVNGNQLCVTAGGVTTCYTVSNTIINNYNFIDTVPGSGVIKIIEDGYTKCYVFSNGDTICYNQHTPVYISYNNDSSYYYLSVNGAAPYDSVPTFSYRLRIELSVTDAHYVMYQNDIPVDSFPVVSGGGSASGIAYTSLEDDSILHFHYFNGTDTSYVWNGGGGSGGSTTADSTIIATASQTAFTFSSVPSEYKDYIIFVNGSAIEPVTYFSTAGNIITFTTGLVVADRVRFKRIK